MESHSWSSFPQVNISSEAHNSFVPTIPAKTESRHHPHHLALSTLPDNNSHLHFHPHLLQPLINPGLHKRQHQSQLVPGDKSKKLPGSLISQPFHTIPVRPSPGRLMISCFGGGAQPEVTNSVVIGDLEQTHVEVHKEAIKASGITVAVVGAILFFGCWYYWRAMRNSAVVRARRCHFFAFAYPFVSSLHSTPSDHIPMASMAQAPPVVQLPPSTPPMYYKEPQWLSMCRYNTCHTPCPKICAFKPMRKPSEKLFWKYTAPQN